MANVKFKRGTHASLLALQSYDDGCFYLTTDTDRLFVAQSASELVELNKSIEVVQSVSQLPGKGYVQAGQFYYIKGTNDTDAENTHNGNILAVCVGFKGNGDPDWVQVNPDTVDGNDDEWVSGFSIVRDPTNAAASSPSSLIYNWTLTQKDIDNHDITTGRGAPLTGSFSIPVSDIVSSGVSVGLSASKSGDDLVIAPSGNGANSSASVKLVAGDNIEFESSGSNYSINATDTLYKLATDTSSKKVSLTEDNAGAAVTGSITFAEGNAIDITVADASNNGNSTVTITHENVTRGTDTNSDADLAFGEGLTVVTGITTNAQGHVTQVATRNLNLPDETEFSVTAVSADNQGKLHVTYSDGTSPTTVDSGVDLFFTYGAASSAATNPQVLNKGNLPVYTRDEIDAKVRELDGMTYKGTVTSTSGLPSANVKNGDTYKVSSSGVIVPAGNGSSTGDEAQIGDLFIAHGSEGNDGYITSATLAWDYIPSGNETDTTYELTVASNVVTLAPEDENSSQQSYSVTFAGGNKLTASTSGTTVTFNHDAVTTTGKLADNATAPSSTNTLDFGDTFTVVHGAKADGYGHITEIQTETFQLPAAPDELTYALDVTATTGTNGNGKIELKDDDGHAEGEIAFQNGNNTTAVVTKNSADSKAIVTINHNTLTPTQTNNTSAGSASVIDLTNGFNAISALSFDSYGHVSGYTTQKFTLPAESIVSLNGGVTAGTGNDANKKATIALDLQDAAGNSQNGSGVSIPSYSLSTSSLKIATTAATSTTPADIAIDIEWGTF